MTSDNKYKIINREGNQNTKSQKNVSKNTKRKTENLNSPSHIFFVLSKRNY